MATMAAEVIIYDMYQSEEDCYRREVLSTLHRQAHFRQSRQEGTRISIFAQKC